MHTSMMELENLKPKVSSTTGKVPKINLGNYREYLTTKQAMRLLNCSRMTISRLVRGNKLRARLVLGRYQITYESIAELMKTSANFEFDIPEYNEVIKNLGDNERD